ncbi:MAG: hypothetical protein ACOX4J_05735 [Anaerovoracaceae bacterium]
MDKKQEVLETIAPPEVTDKESFLKAVRASGVVGLGGAAFPTHVKFNPKNPDEVDTLVINGAECEPYITADYRTMMEDSELLVGGIKTTMKYLNLKKAIIAIEANKEPAIKKLADMVKDEPGIEVFALESPCIPRERNESLFTRLREEWFPRVSYLRIRAFLCLTSVP